MCVDLSHLNRYVQRERYQSMTLAQAVADITASDAQVLHAMKGYHQCALDTKSQLVTTFITPIGYFKYLRAPYGISSISEHYDHRMAEAFTGLTGFRHIVDNIVIYDSDASTHTEHVRAFLKRCADMNIALNLAKCKFHTRYSHWFQCSYSESTNKIVGYLRYCYRNWSSQAILHQDTWWTRSG